MSVSTETRRDVPTNATLIMNGIAVLILALGAAALALLASNIMAAINAGGETGVIILRYLNTYGILLSLALLGFGIYLLRLGIRLFQHQLNDGAWAQQILLWLSVLAVVLTIQAFTTGLNTPDTGGIGPAIVNALPWAVATVVIGGATWWLNKNISLYSGKPKLMDESTRTAWNLLVPTVIVLVVVAARPLEKTFIASLTNDEFARATEIEFVGLDNYAQLLGVRFDAIACTPDEAGACTRDEEGAVVYPRPRDVLDESYRELRFRELSSFELGNTRYVFSGRDADFFKSVGNTLIFSIMSVTLELVLGLFIALVINSKFVGRGMLRTAMLVPWAIPTVVSARLWQIMLRDNQSGFINNFFLNIGLISQSQAWLANSSTQIFTLVAIDVWKTTPFMALILLAGLQTISSEVYEAADVDGANPFVKFFSLTLPLLRPTIAVALVFRTLDAVRVFDVFQVLLGRQQLSMATYNYDTLINNQQLGYASAIGVLIFIIILISTVIYVRLLGVSAE